MAAQEVSAYLEKGEIKNSVNYPNTDLPAAFTVRTCLLHTEDGSIADKAAEAAKAAGASVNNVFTAAKKGMGYTVIDTDREFDTGAIENVIRARILK